jgi:hypothetical protein
MNRSQRGSALERVETDQATRRLGGDGVPPSEDRLVMALNEYQEPEFHFGRCVNLSLSS